MGSFDTRLRDLARRNTGQRGGETGLVRGANATKKNNMVKLYKTRRVRWSLMNTKDMYQTWRKEKESSVACDKKTERAATVW